MLNFSVGVLRLSRKFRGCFNGSLKIAAVGGLLTTACAMPGQAIAFSCEDCFSGSVSGQVASQTSNVTVINSGQSNAIHARARQFHEGGQAEEAQTEGGQINKAGAGDEDFLMDDLGVYLNGSAGFGDRKTSGRLFGFDTDRQETTAGADYKLTDHLLIGTAFGYNYTKNAIIYGLGAMESDTYLGSLYGSFFTDSGFFVDGIFSGASIDYQGHTNTGGVQARGGNQGTEFDVSMTTGYTYSLGGLTLTPQVRVEHISLQLTALNEVGNGGLLVHVNERELESLKTAPGLQMNYAMSFPWGVFVPTMRAEWVHEFQNDSQPIVTKLVNQPTAVRLSAQPDRDFANLSAGFSAQFAHGISAFANYETIQGHFFLNHHAFTGGVRFEF